MKSFCISLMTAAVFANHSGGNYKQHGFDKVRDFFDKNIAVACDNDLNNDIPINNLINAVSDDFEYCEIKGFNDIDVGTYSLQGRDKCLNKDEFREFGQTAWHGKYKDIKYSLNIDQDIDNEKYLSFTVHWTMIKQNGCTVTTQDKNQIYSKDDGTIGKWVAEILDYNDDCSPSTQDGYKVESNPIRPVQPILPDQPVRKYENFHIGSQTDNPSYKPYQSGPRPNPLPRYNNLPVPASGYTVNNKPEELDYNKYIEKEEKPSLAPKAKDDYVMTMKNEGVLVDVLLNDIDLDKPDLSGKKTLIIKEFANGKKGIVLKLGNKLKYLPKKDECGKDTFSYTIADKDDGLTDSAQVYVTIDCPYVGNQYVPEQPSSYGSNKPDNQYVHEPVQVPPSYGSNKPEQPQVSPSYGSNTPYVESEGGLNSLLNKYSDLNKETEEVVPSIKPNTNTEYKPESVPTKGVNNLIKKEREYKLKEFYAAGFECRLKANYGDDNTINNFLGYLSEDAEFCVSKKQCINKDEVKTKMGAAYSDDNESIKYDVIILSNDDNGIQSKCTSERMKKSGCRVIKEEYSSCSFDDKGLIKKFNIERTNRRTVCDDDDDNNDKKY